MASTYLTTAELSERIKYDARTIRDRLKDSVLLEGVHYFRPFGGRKILYIWGTHRKGHARRRIRVWHPPRSSSLDGNAHHPRRRPSTSISGSRASVAVRLRKCPTRRRIGVNATHF